MLAVGQRVDSTWAYSSQGIPLPACYSRDIMPVAREHIPTPEMAAQWPHLQGIADKLLPIGDYDVGLLIGYNWPSALVPREIIPPVNGGPYGQRTNLGWSIIGIVNAAQSNAEDDIGVSHRILTCEVPSDLSDPTSRQYGGEKVFISFSNQVKEVFMPTEVVRMLELDFNEKRFDTIAPSQEDKRFLSILEEGIHVREDGHYEMPLPLRDKDPTLPNNRHMAVR